MTRHYSPAPKDVDPNGYHAIAQAEANGDRRLMDEATIARQIAATEELMKLPLPGYVRVTLRAFHASLEGAVRDA